jgi:hypothetical protein
MGSTTSAMKELKIEETIQEAVVVNNLFSMITTNKYDDDTCINYYNLMSVDERLERNNLNDTYLIVACRNRRVNLAIAILNSDENRLSAINYTYDTALIWALSRELYTVAELMLKTPLECNLSIVNKHKLTALQYACMKTKGVSAAMQILDYPKSCGINVLGGGAPVRSAFHTALSRKKLNVVRKMLP